MTGPIGGEARIVVRADGRRLRPDVERAIQAAERGQSIDIPVNPEFSRDAQGRLRDARGRFVREARGIGQDAGNATGRSFDRSVTRSIGRALSGLAGIIGQGLRFAGAAGSLAGLGAAAAASAASLIQLTAALAPAVGALAALPGTIALGTAALATLQLGLLGVSDAFGAALTGDAEQFNAAIEQLAPSAQDTARALRDLRPAFDELRDSVQGALFEGLDSTLNSLAFTLLGPLRDGMTGVAGQLNDIAVSIGNVLGSAAGSTLLTDTFAALEGILAAVRPALTELTAAMVALGDVGVTALGGLGGGLADIIARFAEFIQGAVESGEALSWIEGAFTVFQQLGAILSELFGVFQSIGQAASSTGGDVLGTFGQLLGILNEFFASTQGQDFLLSLFNSLNSVGSALQPVIVALGNALAGILPSVGDIATALGPGLEALVSGLGAGLGAIAPALVPIADALAGIVEAAAPILGVVGQLLSSLGGPLADILSAAGEGIGAIFEAAQPAIEAILPLFDQFAGILGETLVPVFTTLGELLATIAPIIGELATTLVEQMLPVWQQLSEQIGEILPSLGELITALVEALLPIVQALLPPFLQLTAVLAGPLLSILNLLLPILTFLIELLTPIIELIAGLAGVILDVGVAAIQVIVGWLQQFVDWLTDVWRAGQETRQKIVDAWKGIGEGIGDAIDSVRGWIDDLVGWFRDLPGRVLSAIGDLGSQIWSAITSGIGDLGSLIPGFANGTITGNRTGLAVLHPNEVVVPLTRPARALQLTRDSGLLDLLQNHGLAGPVGSGQAPPHITVNIHSNTLSPDVLRAQVEKAVARALAGTAPRGAY